ncbi:MAG: hypothetical protein U5K71_04280 [Gracilimonas sp.]|nr:hypothetical protein [Gracilimonas sp.]
MARSGTGRSTNAEIYVDPTKWKPYLTVCLQLPVGQRGRRQSHSKACIRTTTGFIPITMPSGSIRTTPEHMIDGNDGGLSIRLRQRRKTWRFAGRAFRYGQFYHVNVDMDYPYNIYGGMQDNGTWQGPAYVWRSGDIRNSYWEELFFGDGFDVAIDQSSGRYVYAMSQQGNVGRVDTETGSSRFVKPHHPGWRSVAL